jgi:hypothetical protein
MAKILERFRNFIPPQTQEEYYNLKQSLLIEGFRRYPHRPPPGPLDMECNFHPCAPGIPFGTPGWIFFGVFFSGFGNMVRLGEVNLVGLFLQAKYAAV